MTGPHLHWSMILIKHWLTRYCLCRQNHNPQESLATYAWTNTTKFAQFRAKLQNIYSILLITAVFWVVFIINQFLSNRYLFLVFSHASYMVCLEFSFPPSYMPILIIFFLISFRLLC